MPVRTSAQLGAPTWMNLTTSDVEGAQRFYGTVFGWTFESPVLDYGGYVNASLHGRHIAGFVPNTPSSGAPDGWTTYLHTDDVDATLKSLLAAGGQTFGGAMDVPAKGRMAMVNDPTGAKFGLWQAAGHDGFEVVGEAGAPVWHQLTTRDYRKALDFYTEVFGWQLDVEADTPEFRYSNALFDGEPLLGVMDGSAFLPEGVSSNYSVFLGADDIDKTLEVIVANGGAVVRGPEDTPYGRLASATDLTGAGLDLASIQD